jgi:tetratricopeptide (TPR) repeat protein
VLLYGFVHRSVFPNNLRMNNLRTRFKKTKPSSKKQNQVQKTLICVLKFELRYKEVERARLLYERVVEVHPVAKNWLRFAKFEEQHGHVESARETYERAIHFFGDEYLDEKLCLAFARFEEHQKEHERARAIYKYALEKLDESKRDDIMRAYTIHEKKHGDRSGIEAIISNKRKTKYEEVSRFSLVGFTTLDWS